MRMRSRRISPIRELALLICEGFWVLLGETRNLVISLLFPVAATAVTIWIAGEEMFLNCEATQSALFIVVCAAIWGGLFNSIQVIVKERDIVKREYTSGALRLECFTASRAILQMGLCAIQSAILCLSFFGVEEVYGNEMLEEGLIFDSIVLEYYITVFLVMYAADTMGLMISCFVKSEQLASQLSPYILIVQLLFSGVLFKLKDVADTASNFMLSRWGMEALGSSSNLNEIQLALQDEFPMIPHEVNEAYTYTAEHLGEVWLILLVFVLVPLIIGNFALYGVKKDSRG